MRSFFVVLLLKIGRCSEVEMCTMLDWNVLCWYNHIHIIFSFGRKPWTIVRRFDRLYTHTCTCAAAAAAVVVVCRVLCCCWSVSQVEAQVSSEDVGHDLAAVQSMLKKHHLLEADITAHEVGGGEGRGGWVESY